MRRSAIRKGDIARRALELATLGAWSLLVVGLAYEFFLKLA
jgi:hypothetical protein